MANNQLLGLLKLHREMLKTTLITLSRVMQLALWWCGLQMQELLTFSSENVLKF